jgi:sugar lactone lactonase YvrE
MAINRVVRFALSDAGSTAAEGINITQARLNAKVEAGELGLAAQGATNISNVCHDYSGNLYITDAGKHCILKVDEGGRISVFAGLSGSSGDLSGVSIKDSNGLNRAAFNTPRGICCDKSGKIYVCDTANDKIKVIDGDEIALVAGSTAGLTDGVGASAQFDTPYDVCVDKAGVLYVADTSNNAVRQIKDGNVLTIAGDGGVGDAENVKANKYTSTFNAPRSVAVDAEGNVYVLDTGNRKIKKIVPRGWVYLLSGDGSAGRSLGTAPSWGYTCSYNSLLASDIDESGNLYILDFNGPNGSRLVKVDYEGKPGVVVDFKNVNENTAPADIACTPGQKLLTLF